MNGRWLAGRAATRAEAFYPVGQDGTETALAEIERCAKTGQYVQDQCRAARQRTARAALLAIFDWRKNWICRSAIHSGGYGGHAPTGGGWPSYYTEEHQSNAHSMAAQLTSLVLEGVPERFPRLKVVFIEGGLAISRRRPGGWISNFERFRDEVPHLKRRPSEYVREQLLVYHAAGRGAGQRQHLRSVIDWIGVDRLLFSSDYPHWDFRRSAFCHQDAAHRGRTRQDLQQQRARILQALIYGRHIVAPHRRHPARRNKVVGCGGPRHRRVPRHGEFFGAAQIAARMKAHRSNKAVCIARLTSDEPGVYRRSRIGEMLRCPWHGWEFDIRNGQSYFDPARVKVRAYPVVIEDGETLAKGPFVAETFPVYVETVTSSSRSTNNGSGRCDAVVGIFDQNDRGPHQLGEQYEDRLEADRILRYRRAFRTYHMSEHHADAAEPDAVTERVPCRGGAAHQAYSPRRSVYVLPRIHPLRLAEEICMLDHLSRGRLEVGIGRGASPHELGIFRRRSRSAPAMYVEATTSSAGADQPRSISKASTTISKTCRSRSGRRSFRTRPSGMRFRCPKVWRGRRKTASTSFCAGPCRRFARSRIATAPSGWLAGNTPGELPLLGINRFVIAADTDGQAMELGTPRLAGVSCSFMKLWKKHGTQRAMRGCRKTSTPWSAMAARWRALPLRSATRLETWPMRLARIILSRSFLRRPVAAGGTALCGHIRPRGASGTARARRPPV